MKTYPINIDVLSSKCSPLAIVLYMIMQLIKDEDNEVNLPYKTFASLTRKGVTSVKSTMYELLDNGFIGIYPCFYEDGAQAPNIYVIYD